VPDPTLECAGCYLTRIQGEPCISSKHRIFPKPGTDFSNPEAAFAPVGMTVTGLPALNAIPVAVAAPLGVITSADLPLRAFAGRFKRMT
jgi:4-hydroxy-tetrahydrodipicolinate reductase